MTTTLSSVSFDYDSVDKDTASKLRYFEGALLTAHCKHIEAIWAVGSLLADAHKEFAKHGDGKFQKWVEATQPFSVKTARNYINAWTAFKDSATVAQIEPSAMYILATNEEAKKQALKLVKRGEKITQKRAKELIAEFPRSVDSDGADSPDQAADPSAAAETVEFQDKPLIVCPHCEADLSKNTTFDERIVFGEYQCPECDQRFEIYPDDENCIDIRLVAGISADEDVEPAAEQPPAAAAIICPLCESDETVWIPKTGGGQFIPSTYTCGECEEPFVVDEAGKVTRVVAAGDNSDNEPVTPALTAPTVPYTSEDDGETFQTTMPSIDLSAGPVDPPDLSDCETMKMGWRLHVQPIWLVADDANQRAMVAFVKDLL